MLKVAQVKEISGSSFRYRQFLGKQGSSEQTIAPYLCSLTFVGSVFLLVVCWFVFCLVVVVV